MVAGTWRLAHSHHTTYLSVTYHHILLAALPAAGDCGGCSEIGSLLIHTVDQLD